ncbi:MAG: methyltransferase domain-containing protein [Rhodobacterales bacterium]
MGIDYVLFERLAELSTRFQPKGRTLMLGRHSFPIQTQFRFLYEDALKRNNLPGRRFDYLQEDGYCENLMEKLGFGKMETMDFSDYEGASILHDLNKPVAKKLEKKFDFIFDGGTIEHVFNVPVALENVFRMLKPGGRFVSANGHNGWSGHGIYQFNPELVWTFWGRTCNCTVHSCLGIKKIPLPEENRIEFADPALTGARLRLKGKIPEGRVYLYYEVERTAKSAIGDDTLQSDYETKRQSHKNAGKTRLDA